jgi:hypothetical protein
MTSFLSISIVELNLFSFMLGMVYTLCNVRWGNQSNLWMHVVIYMAFVALYYFAKAEGWLEILNTLVSNQP